MTRVNGRDSQPAISAFCISQRVRSNLSATRCCRQINWQQSKIGPLSVSTLSCLFKRVQRGSMKPLFAIACIVIASMPTAAEKPCIALDDKSPDAVTTNLTYHALIETAVTSSGDVDFFSTPHKGCWTIKVLAIKSEPPQRGYTLSWVGLDPHGNFLYHGVTTGAEEIFEQTMRSAAASTITRIRRAGTSKSSTPSVTSTGQGVH
jgi:hypothetical protein